MQGKPSALPVLVGNVPADLRAMPRWVMWRFTYRGGKWAKVPYQTNGRAASSTNPATWASFDDVCDALIMGGPKGPFDGIGIVLGDGLHGVDLDDCRDPATGELTAQAQQILDRLQGIAEVSPSETGIKILTRSNLDRARVKHELGIECYADGRYFTVTGHRVNGHDSLPLQMQDLGWLVRDVLGDSPDGLGRTGGGGGGLPDGADASELALANFRAPLDGWDLERVVDEVLPHLDPDAGYHQWTSIGMALHHQGQGDEAWLQVWDDWSAGSSKWVEGQCAEKWKSFSTLRTRGEPVTLASLLKATKDQRNEVRAGDARGLLDELLQAVEDCTEPRHLQERIAAQAAHAPELIEVDRHVLAAAIVKKAKDLSCPVPLQTVRGWVMPRVSAASAFPHLNDDGNPLCTLENMRVLLRQLGYTVRYNVIKKSIEVLVPGAGFTRDNRDNAALAILLSECEKVRMPTRHTAQYLIAVADENPYNPVAAWLDSASWDGVSRIDAFCATVRASGHAELKNRLLRKWLIQAVAAALSPDGIATQGILTFVGPQNIGKTTWFQRLAPAELDIVLTGHTLDTKSKDSVFIALTYWLVELGEVDATFRKSDISALKSFVTQPQDKLRRPYAATESTFGRRTAFGATVNDEQFLHDPTGNRRFWTVEVEGFEVDHGIDMQQVWAEAKVLWESGEKWFLDQGEVAELNEHNDKFVVSEPVEELVSGGYDWSGVMPWREMTAGQVLVELGLREPNRYQCAVAGRVLARLNGGQRRKSNGRWLFSVPQVEFLS